MTISIFKFQKPELRNAAQAAPSLDNWADDNPEVPLSPLLLKIFGCPDRADGKRPPIAKAEWTNTLSPKWTTMQKRANTAHS